jgi:hypothetical protein
MGRIFKVDAEPLITDMKKDFDQASAVVSSSNHGSKLKAVWLDCVGRCCKTDPGVEPEVFVGAGSGAPNMLMNEAGLVNAFKNEDGNWKCVKESAVINAAPDVMIIADADWDKALDKITWLYKHKDFCKMDVLQGARFVQIPFSATTLGPRNGPAAHDLAIASLHVRTGSTTPVQKSGVGSYNPMFLENHVKGLLCTVQKDKVKYQAITDATKETSSSYPECKVTVSLVALFCLLSTWSSP